VADPRQIFLLFQSSPPCDHELNSQYGIAGSSPSIISNFYSSVTNLKKGIFMTLTRSLLISILCFTLFPAPSHAFGKKKPSAPSEPADTQSYPTRVVSFGPFIDTPFTLPDGKTLIDVKSLLPLLVLTEMQQATNRLRGRGVIAPGSDNENKDRYELRGGITSFEASAFSGSISFGYKPGAGDIGHGVLVGGEGKVSFKIGSLGMDFNIVDNQRHEVVAVGRGSALSGGVDLTVDLDFGVIKTPVDFVFNSPMTPIFRAAARNAILQMANDPNTNFFMDWDAQVTKIDMNLKRIFFNAGARDGIAASNVFTVYDDHEMRLGEIKVDGNVLDHDQAGAYFKADPNSTLINSTRIGDSVKIFFKDVPH
jgi:hypothetical protein